MSPYRASLGGIYGSGVYPAAQRQPLVDVGSIVDAISGGIDAHARRVAMRVQQDRQAKADQQSDADRMYERGRQATADARQATLDQQAAELHASRLETEKQNRLATAYEKGLVPGQQVTASPIDSFVPGLSAVYNNIAAAQGGTALPTQAMPAHFDYTQGGEYKAKHDEETQRAQSARALELLRGGFQLRAAQARGQQGQDGSPMGEQRKFQREQALGDDFRNAAKPFQQVADNIGVIRAAGPAALKKDPQAQMSIIYGFMKLQDPGSTVREGEYASAQNAGSVPEKLRAQYNKVLGGGFLDPDQVKRFLEQTEIQSKAWQQRFAPLRDQYRRRAQAWQVDPENVVYDYFAPVNTGGAGAPPVPTNPWRQ